MKSLSPILYREQDIKDRYYSDLAYNLIKPMQLTSYMKSNYIKVYDIAGQLIGYELK